MNKKKHKTLVHYLPIYGCIATGLIYVAIGVIAILSFLKLKDGGADENRLFAYLSQYFAGKILVAIILAGTLCYVIWRFYEVYTDPYHYGSDLRGMARRTGISLSTVADILIVFSAFRFIFGIGTLDEKEQLPHLREMVHSILQKNSGQIAVISIGAVFIVTAIVQFFYGITRGYRERLEVKEFSQGMKMFVHFSGITGYFSRGIILAIMGYFYLKAGITLDAQYVVDTDKAFDYIGDNIGHAAFILVAAGTIFYGVFMIALGTAYDVDRD